MVRAVYRNAADSGRVKYDRGKTPHTGGEII